VVFTVVETLDYVNANRTEPITEPQPSPDPPYKTDTSPSSDPTTTNPAPDGVGPEEYDPYWGWYNPSTSSDYNNLVDPHDEFGEAAFDMARFIRLVVAVAMSKVNPNPEGTAGDSGSDGLDPTFGGILGGDPADDQPIIYTDTSPGGNPIILFFPPKTPVGG
jgi:hypothetical protein